jgi:hypothetical protein
MHIVSIIKMCHIILTKNQKIEFYTTLATIDDYTYFTYFRFSIM